MLAWMRALRKELDEIEASEGALIEPACFIQTLIATLWEINKVYCLLPAFKSMFYDLTARLVERRAQAAVILLQRLSERLRSELPPEEKRRSEWPDNFIWFHSEGRLKLKRFLAVMGNLELRRDLLGF